MILVTQIHGEKKTTKTLVNPTNITTITYVNGTSEAVITFTNRENVRISTKDADKFKS